MLKCNVAAPTITLGTTPLTIAHDATYSEPGVVVTDNLTNTTLTQITSVEWNQGNIGWHVTNNIASAADTYSVVYEARDLVGNTITATRTVIRESPPVPGSAFFNQDDGTFDVATVDDDEYSLVMSGDFTIETFIRIPTSGPYENLNFRTLISSSNYSGSGSLRIYSYDMESSSLCHFKIYVYETDANGVKLDYTIFTPVGGVNGTKIYADNNWHHFAYTRQGATHRVFIDGVSHYTGVPENWQGIISPIVTFTDSKYYIGEGWQSLHAYLSNFRMTTDTALYTNHFTPPTSTLDEPTNGFLAFTLATELDVSPGYTMTHVTTYTDNRDIPDYSTESPFS